MSKRILTFGAMATILVAALISVLAVLDVITIADAREALGDTMAVIVIITGAVTLMVTVAALGKRA